MINKDPWGNDYVLVREGSKFFILCFGKDGEEGTEDDIRYPAAKE